MDSVIRALVTYIFLLLVFRVAGKRSLAEMSSFELVILLIISETTQQAMVDDDHSMTNAAIAILTLTGAGIVMTVLKERFPGFQRVVAGAPLLLIENGEIMHERLKHSRIGVDGGPGQSRSRAHCRHKTRAAGNRRRHFHHP
jgi:uncharacterized membrane protein YcaP (DUF421 family)